MRKFYLIADGTRIPMNAEDGILFTDPTGLGVQYETSYTDITDGFFFNKEYKQSQVKLCGTVNFLNSAYSRYRNFADTVLTARELVFVYQPESVEYKCDVKLDTLTKTESTVGIYMSCPIQFSRLGMWYTDETVTGAGIVSVTSGGQVASCVVVNASSALVNPRLYITHNSEIVAEADIEAELEAGDLFEYSNLYDDSHIFGTISGVATDFLTLCDLSKPIYGRVFGEYLVYLTDSNNAEPQISVNVRKYWRSV